jgi:hypothetical protein
MGRRQRKRARAEGAAGAPAAATTDYTDPEGNVLTLRDRLSPGTVGQVRRLDARPGASAEDRWHRRTELLFERLAVRWTIAGLPLEGERELLGRYRLADSGTRTWIREAIDEHLSRVHPELSA